MSPTADVEAHATTMDEAAADVVVNRYVDGGCLKRLNIFVYSQCILT